MPISTNVPMLNFQNCTKLTH